MKRSLIPKIAVIALSSPLEVGAGNARQKLIELGTALKENKCDLVLSATISTHQESATIGRQLAGLFPDMVVFLPVCWFEDYLVTDFLEECKAPLLLWALPGMETGSLCGCQQLGAFLKYLGHPFFHVFGEVVDRKIIAEALKYFRASTLYSRLRRSKIGLLGSRVNGMTHTSPNEFMLKKSMGARVIPIPFGKLDIKRDSVKIKSIWDSFKERCGNVYVSEECGLESINMYCALKEIIAEYGLDAITVGCYPDLMGKVCIASSLLADEGIPLACEGDVHGAIAQLILTTLSGTPTINADFLDPYDDNSIIFAHCGSSSLSLIDKNASASLDSVRLIRQGVCVLFPAKPGNVTLLNITAVENVYYCAMLPGEAIVTEMVFPGNPVKVKFNSSAKNVTDWIFHEGLGHHWMIVYGDYTEEIRAWARLVQRNFIFKEI
jgi:L-fucose isomerase-like protein